MTDETVTDDLGDFGHIELDKAKDLLTALQKEFPDFLTKDIHILFNRNSGYVFLSDEDYNVAMTTDNGDLEQFYSCSNTGEEGFLSELKKTASRECKKEIREAGL